MCPKSRNLEFTEEIFRGNKRKSKRFFLRVQNVWPANGSGRLSKTDITVWVREESLEPGHCNVPGTMGMSQTTSVSFKHRIMK